MGRESVGVGCRVQEINRLKWSEREIARNLFWHTFRSKHLVIVPNCCWPGSECDLLIVRNDLRLMDVEIKISRADLKADIHKDKWLEPHNYKKHGFGPDFKQPRATVSHPQKIWKHYYALPDEIWTGELLESIPAVSGIILLRNGATQPWLRIVRQAKPNSAAGPITAEDVCAIAKSQACRMWEAYGEIDTHRREIERERERQQESAE